MKTPKYIKIAQKLTQDKKFITLYKNLKSDKTNNLKREQLFEHVRDTYNLEGQDLGNAIEQADLLIDY